MPFDPNAPFDVLGQSGGVSERLVGAVKGFEGFTPKSQWDYKQNSVGYGTKGAPGEVIDEAEADRRLRTELTSARAQVDRFAPDAPEGVKEALTSLTFNAGGQWMNAGLGQAIQAGDYNSARDLFLQYNKAGGGFLPGLQRRRNAEAQWFGDSALAYSDQPQLPAGAQAINRAAPIEQNGPARGFDLTQPFEVMDGPANSDPKGAQQGQNGRLRIEIQKEVAPPVTSPEGFDQSFQPTGYQPPADLAKRGDDIAQMGERYGLTDPQQILEADRRAASSQGTGWGAFNAAMQGATLGLSDEVRGAFDALTGGDYGTSTAGQREALRRFSRDNPGTAVAAEIGGALATAPFLPQMQAARGASLAARMGAGAVMGAGYGAAYGFGTGQGVEDRLTGAASGGALGGVGGGAIPAVVSGVKGVGQLLNEATGRPLQVLRGVINPEAEAARRVGTALAIDNPEAASAQDALRRAAQGIEAGQAQGTPAVVGDFGGETTRALARSAANTSPAAREALTSVTQDRFGAQGQRAQDLLSRVMGGTGNPVERTEMLRREAAKANRPLYEKAYREGGSGIWTRDLRSLVQAPVVRDAIRQAERTGQNRAVAEGITPVRNPFVFDDAGNMILKSNADGSRALPNLQFWDQVKRNLDDTVNSLLRAGEKSAASDAMALRSKLLSALDSASPTYARARQTAASFFGAQDAVEAGQNFVTSRMGNDEARRALAKMKPAERELFAEGFADQLVNRIREVGDRSSLINAVFGSQAARDRVQIALGPKRAQDIETFIRVENTMNLLRNAVTGNSTTARQLVELGLAGGAGAWAGGGDLTDPKAYMAAAAVFGLQKGRVKVDEKVARRVGELLASGSTEDIMKAVNMFKGKGGLNALRTLENGMNRIASEQAGGARLLPNPSQIGSGRADQQDQSGPRVPSGQ